MKKITKVMSGLCLAALMCAAFAGCGGGVAEDPNPYSFTNPGHAVADTDADMTIDGVFDEARWNESKWLTATDRINASQYADITFTTSYGEKGVYFGMQVEETGTNIYVNHSRTSYYNSCIEMYMGPVGVPNNTLQTLEFDFLPDGTYSNRVNSNGLVIPYHFTFGAYSYMFSIGRIPKGFLITFCVSFIGAIVNVVMVSLAAYPLTKSDLPGKKIISFFIVFTMFFGGGLIPQYLIIRGLGFVNKNFSSLFGLVLPFCLNAFNIIILRNFFRTVPESVIESAEIDGAGEFRILFQFVMPLAMSGIVTIALFSVVGYWNDWFWPMLIVRNTEYYTLALVLRELLAQPVQPGVGSPPPDSQLLTEASEAAAIVISILPLIIIYPFVQKFFEKGIILGAVKG